MKRNNGLFTGVLLGALSLHYSVLTEIFHVVALLFPPPPSKRALFQYSNSKMFVIPLLRNR